MTLPGDTLGQLVTDEYKAVGADTPLSDICSLVDRNSVPWLSPTTGSCSLGLAGVVLVALGDAGDDYLVFVRSSFAGYLADWLLDAALEFTVELSPPPPPAVSHATATSVGRPAVWLHGSA